MTDKELKDLVASLAVESKKTEQLIKELRESQKETGQLIKELRESQKQTDEQLRQTDEQLKQTDEQLKQTSQNLIKSQDAFDKRMQKLDEKLEKIGRMVGAIGNNQGDVAEEYFVNSLKKRLKIGVMEFDYLVPNYIIESKHTQDEYDILLVNGDVVAAIEVKYKFHINDLDKLPKKIENLKNIPQYKNYKIYIGIAGFHISNDVVKEALKRGYFVLKRSGDVIETFGEELLVA
jgi:chromosome segregation ATPase